jgi:polypeptide N-acetylgalactosaminyltransferase
VNISGNFPKNILNPQHKFKFDFLKSYNRTIPDTRHPACARKVYNMDRLAESPASVVVIFFNEPYSVILRTVYSILNTADARLLKEIVLVDDASTNEELLDKFGYYVKTRLPNKVKLIRSKSR